MTMLRYIKEGRIKVDKTRNTERVTFHDSCNNARSCGFYEEPRELLNLVVTDFQEMYPNRTENYCCTGGGGAMSMSEYTPRRLESAKIKADQITATGAKIVVTSCHNCVDGLGDLIKHYKLDCEVKQLVDLVADALVLDELEKPVAVAAAAEVEARSPRGWSPAEPKPSPRRHWPAGGSWSSTTRRRPDLPHHRARGRRRRGLRGHGRRRGARGHGAGRSRTSITLDLSMPGKDGVEAFAELRRHPGRSQEIPVCVVTGHPEFREGDLRPAGPAARGLHGQAGRRGGSGRQPAAHPRAAREEGLGSRLRGGGHGSEQTMPADGDRGRRLRHREAPLPAVLRGDALLPVGPRPELPDHRRQPPLPRGLRRPARRALLRGLQAAGGSLPQLPGGGDLRRRREPRQRAAPDQHATARRSRSWSTPRRSATRAARSWR